MSETQTEQTITVVPSAGGSPTTSREPAATPRKSRSTSSKTPARSAKSQPKSRSAAKPAAAPAKEAKGATTNAKRAAVMHAMIVASADLIDQRNWTATVKRFPALAELEVSRKEAIEFLSNRLSYAPTTTWDARLDPPKNLSGRQTHVLPVARASRRSSSKPASKSA